MNSKLLLEVLKKQKYRGEAVNSRDSIMKNETNVNKVTCYNCGKQGHKKFQCRVTTNLGNKYCKICKNKSHNTSDCRKNNSV